MIAFCIFMFCVNGWLLQTGVGLLRMTPKDSWERSVCTLAVWLNSAALSLCTIKLISIAIS